MKPMNQKQFARHLRLCQNTHEAIGDQLIAVLSIPSAKNHHSLNLAFCQFVSDEQGSW